MDIQHLKYFVAVATYGNFTKAAQVLYVTQPTISKMIKNIENELGVELFERAGKQVKLTDAGALILKQAKVIIGSFENITNELDDLKQLRTGNLQIGLPPMIGSRFFPRIIREFHQEFPRIHIQLVEDGAVKVEQDVGNGLLDLGVVVLPVNAQQFHSFSFVKETLWVIMHKDHMLADKEALNLIDLKEDPFILFRKDFALHERIITECVRSGFHPNIVYESSQWDFITEMVASKLGVALLPETVCKHIQKEEIIAVPLKNPEIPWHLGIIWRKDRYLSFAAREWLRFASERLPANLEENIKN